MKIYPTEITSGMVDIVELFEITGKKMPHGDINLKVGVAGFPDNVRHPAEAMAAHDQDEISLILDGNFLLETREGGFTCYAGDVIHIPAGEEHASKALGNGKVFYVLFG